MKKSLILITILAFAMLIVTSCSGNDAAEEPNYGEEQVDNNTVYNAVYVANDNKMAFIALNKDGSVSFCLDKYVMGYGKYVITDNLLAISNEYTGYTDELTIANTENEGIKLKGHIRWLNSTEFSYVEMTLNKSSEELNTSLKGEEWQDSGWNPNGTVRVYYSFHTEHEGDWATYLIATGTLVKKSDFHYIARKLIDTDNNGSVRTRKITYYHSDINKDNPKLNAIDEEMSLDIIVW